MQRSTFLQRTAGLIALAATKTRATPAQAAVTLMPTTYKGWRNAYRLANGEVEVVVVPELGGRIMRYGFIGGPNQLWENSAQAGKPMIWGEWTNHGGEKAWPWPQDLWGWPPPVAADQAPFQVAVVDDRTIELTSSRIVPYGVRIVRRIALDAKGTGVHLTTRLVRENVGPSLPLAPWTIAQVPAQPVVYARLVPSPSGEIGSVLKLSEASFKAVVPDANGIMRISRDPSNGSKIGMDADLLATVQNDTLFTIAMEASPTNDANATYVQGERTQIYNQPDNADDAARGVTPYIELEMTAPKQIMKRGEFVTLTQSWHLRRMKEEERGEERLSTFLKQLP